jgi:TP901 family phage tail tape measure protein
MAYTLNLGTLLINLRANTAHYNSALRVAERNLDTFAHKVNRFSGVLTKYGSMLTSRVTVPLSILGVTAVRSFAQFDDAMERSLAIMKDVSQDMRAEMERLTQTLSTKNMQSATELANAYFYLSSAGLSAKESIEMLPVISNFAAAGFFDLEEATTLAMDSMKALGLYTDDHAKNIENTKRVTDLLVGANTLANATTEQFSKALTTNAAAAMRTFNIRVEEGIAVLASMADQELKASAAGNAFTRFLFFTIKGFKKNTDVWKQLGISIQNAEGNLLPLYDILENMQDVLGDMSDLEKFQTMLDMGFQAKSLHAILPLLDQTDRIREYTYELLKMGNICEVVAHKNLRSLGNQLKIVWNNMTIIGRDIGRILKPMLLNLSKEVVKLRKEWQKLTPEIQRNIVLMGVFIALLGPALILLGKIVGMLHMIGAILFVIFGTGIIHAFVVSIKRAVGSTVRVVFAGLFGFIIGGFKKIGVKISTFLYKLPVTLVSLFGKAFVAIGAFLYGIFGSFAAAFVGAIGVIILAVVIAIMAIVAAIELVIEYWNVFLDSFKFAFDVLKRLGSVILDFFKFIFDSIIDFAKNHLGGLYKAVKIVVAGILMGFNILLNLVTLVVDVTTSILSVIVEIFKVVWNFFELLFVMALEILGLLGDVLVWFLGLLGVETDNLIEKFMDFAVAFREAMEDAAEVLRDNFGWISEKIQWLSDNLKIMTHLIKHPIKAIKGDEDFLQEVAEIWTGTTEEDLKKPWSEKEKKESSKDEKEGLLAKFKAMLTGKKGIFESDFFNKMPDFLHGDVPDYIENMIKDFENVFDRQKGSFDAVEGKEDTFTGTFGTASGETYTKYSGLLSENAITQRDSKEFLQDIADYMKRLYDLENRKYQEDSLEGMY